MTESKILSLYRNIRVRGNPHSRIFYTVNLHQKFSVFFKKEFSSILINFKVSHLAKVGRNQAHIYANVYSLREKCPYSEFFWSVFSRIRTEYREVLRTSPYSVQMQENRDRRNSAYGHFFYPMIF